MFTIIDDSGRAELQLREFYCNYRNETSLDYLFPRLTQFFVNYGFCKGELEIDGKIVMKGDDKNHFIGVDGDLYICEPGLPIPKNPRIKYVIGSQLYIFDYFKIKSYIHFGVYEVEYIE